VEVWGERIWYVYCRDRHLLEISPGLDWMTRLMADGMGKEGLGRFKSGMGKLQK
jgi:hypothetical protein